MVLQCVFILLALLSEALLLIAKTDVFDGVPVGLGITLMNVCHPGWIIHPVRDIFRPENSEFAETKKSGSGSQDSTQASVV